MRWAWSFDSYSARETMGTAKRLLLPPMIGALREWDKVGAPLPENMPLPFVTPSAIPRAG
jgi:hypothetical protein